MTAAQMTPEHAIESLPVLLAKLDSMRAALECATIDARAQWERMGKYGGQRADHAAKLLFNLVGPRVSEIGAFCDRVQTQLDAMHSAPFAEPGR
jgi:hypothetical protein